MVYEKDGEMERVLEKQAELIGQFEAEENAQREWEEKFSMSRDSATVHTFPYQISNVFYLVRSSCIRLHKLKTK